MRIGHYSIRRASYVLYIVTVLWILAAMATGSRARTVYSASHLFLIRKLSGNLRRCVTNRTLDTIASLGILRYRGCSAGQAVKLRRELAWTSALSTGSPVSDWSLPTLSSLQSLNNSQLTISTLSSPSLLSQSVQPEADNFEGQSPAPSGSTRSLPSPSLLLQSAAINSLPLQPEVGYLDGQSPGLSGSTWSLPSFRTPEEGYLERQSPAVSGCNWSPSLPSLLPSTAVNPRPPQPEGGYLDGQSPGLSGSTWSLPSFQTPEARYLEGQSPAPAGSIRSLPSPSLLLQSVAVNPSPLQPDAVNCVPVLYSFCTVSIQPFTGHSATPFFLPCFLLSNVRSINKKVDELSVILSNNKTLRRTLRFAQGPAQRLDGRN